MKRKAIISAALTAALMLAGAVGGSLAWFTSEAKNDVNIASGTVKVASEVELVGAYSLDVPRTDGKFENGGTYELNGAVLELDRMTPGDSVVLKIDVVNQSNVDIRWRLNATGTGELFAGLDFGVYTDAALETPASGLGVWSGVTSAASLGTYYVKVALPEEAGNEYQGTSAAVTLLVEAVQGNMVIGTAVEAPDMGDDPTREEVTQFTDDVLINSEEEYLTINLVADTRIYVRGHTIYFGDEEITKEITINGNGHKLIWELRDSDCSDIHMANPDAFLTIKNCDMTADHVADPNDHIKGTWNAHDICFDCNVNLMNVNSDISIALSGGPGQIANLKNVNITESYQVTDVYGLWITTGATVNIDGLNIKSVEPTGMSSFRTLKIDSQYNNGDVAQGKQDTILNIANATFASAKKSAILVKSMGQTTITASNLDISAVAKDSVNAVWADASYAGQLDRITYTGCTAIDEP